MPSSSNFHRSVPALHDIADTNQLAKGNESVRTSYKDFLRNYLEDIRETKDGHGFKQVHVYTKYRSLRSLHGDVVKLLVLLTRGLEFDPGLLQSFLSMYDLSCWWDVKP